MVNMLDGKYENGKIFFLCKKKKFGFISTQRMGLYDEDAEMTNTFFFSGGFIMKRIELTWRISFAIETYEKINSNVGSVC